MILLTDNELIALWHTDDPAAKIAERLGTAGLDEAGRGSPARA